MDVTITFLGNSATLKNILDAHVVARKVSLHREAIFAAEDIPADWVPFSAGLGGDVLYLTFPPGTLLIEVK